jgi:hypothetical protein
MSKLLLSMILLAGVAVADEAQMGIVVAYQGGKAVAAKAVGFADNLDDCQKGLQEFLTTVDPVPGVVLVPVCTPLPPAPAESLLQQKKDEAKGPATRL